MCDSDVKGTEVNRWLQKVNASCFHSRHAAAGRNTKNPPVQKHCAIFTCLEKYLMSIWSDQEGEMPSPFLQQVSIYNTELTHCSSKVSSTLGLIINWTQHKGSFKQRLTDNLCQKSNHSSNTVTQGLAIHQDNWTYQIPTIKSYKRQDKTKVTQIRLPTLSVR